MHGAHSLAAARQQSISGYSNTISHVVPRSCTKLLSNYQHNHIWLLIMCVLVSFQKVPARESDFYFLKSEGDLMDLVRHIWNVPFRTCVFSFRMSLDSFLLLLTYVSLYPSFIYYFSVFKVWQHRCFNRPIIKAVTVIESERETERCCYF